MQADGALKRRLQSVYRVHKTRREFVVTLSVSLSLPPSHPLSLSVSVSFSLSLSCYVLRYSPPTPCFCYSTVDVVRSTQRRATGVYCTCKIPPGSGGCSFTSLVKNSVLHSFGCACKLVSSLFLGRTPARPPPLATWDPLSGLV